MKTFNSPIIILAIVGSLFYGLQQTTETIAERLSLLPITGMTEQAPSAPSIDNLKTLYPLVAKNITETPPTDEIVEINNAFVSPKPQITAATEPTAPDYFNALKQQEILTLIAIADTGAIINNRLYTWGSPITAYSYPNGTRTASPRLQRGVKPNTVLIKETPGTRSFTLTL